jgi:Alpha amylase, catalytic domain
MFKWPKYPIFYEINTWVWLYELRQSFGSEIDLSSIPSAVWDALADLGFDAVWLMGVWQRSQAGVAIANRNHDLVETFRRSLSDYTPEDNVGSAYCIRQYVVDPQLGGPKGLAAARRELASRGMHLILDFVPNHVAPDHSWLNEHPEYFITGSADDLKSDPTSFIECGDHVFALGRDPYFPAWLDVLQLNAFSLELRKAVAKTVAAIADQCDGVRCDMAMLFLNSIFEQTWRNRGGARPATEYWTDLISGVKQIHPSFLFIAESYWDLEWQLQQYGFDFCYDKRLYDRLCEGSAERIRLHLTAEPGYQQKLVRFIENHDEPRAATVFSAKERAAAVVMATVPGARLLHEGQLEGRKQKVPPFLRRRPQEALDMHLQTFYRKLLNTLGKPSFRDGEWRLCECSGWPDNQSCKNLLAWSWQRDEYRSLVVVNFSGSSAQGRVHVPWSDLQHGVWRLSDSILSATYDRDGTEMSNSGLYVELGPWEFNSFSLEKTSVQETPTEIQNMENAA